MSLTFKEINKAESVNRMV